MRGPRSRALFLGAILLGVIVDQWTKGLAFDAVSMTVRGPAEIEVIKGFFYITEVRNPGAMWGLFQSVPSDVWIVLRGTIALALATYVLCQKSLSAWLTLAFGLILTGALGNLYDNCFAPQGMVRDFVQWIFWGWRFPAFNVADSCITVGATILFVHFLWADVKAVRERRRARAAQRA